MATTAAVALSLIVGTALATWQAFRATQERDRTVIAEELAADEANRARDAEQRAVAEAEKALTEAAISEAVVEFLNRDLLDQADPRNEPDRDISLRAVVDRAVERIEGRFEEQPLVEARIRVTLAGCLHSLGEYQKAEEQFRQAHQLYKAELGPDHRSTLVSEGNIAVALTGLRNYSEAESIIRDVLEREREVLGTDDHNTLWSMSLLALLLGFQGGDHEDWEETARDVLRMREARYSADHPQVLWSRYEVARAISYGRSDAARREAEELLWEILRVQQRVLSADHPDCMRTQEQLASSIQGQRRFVESEAIHRDVVERRRRVLGWGHPQTLFSTNGLGRALWRQHRYEEAATLLNEALEHFDLSNEDANSWIHENLSLQSIVAGELSDHVRAVELARLASEVRTDLYGLDDERTREANHELLDRCLKGAWHYATATDPDNRLPVQSLEMARTAVALDPQNAEAMSILGVAQVRNGDWGEAVSILEKSRSMHDEGDPEHRFFLAMALWKAGRADDALVAFDEALSWLYGSQRREEQYRFRAEAESVIGLNEIHDFVQSADETASVSHLQKLAHVQAQLRLNDVVGEGYARVVELAESQGRDATLIWRDLYPLGQIFEHIAEQSTQRPQLWEQRGDYYAVRGYWQEAAACYRQSAGIIQLGCCLLLSGDEDGYRTLCARQLKRFDANAESIDPHELAQLCSIAPQAGVDREQIVDSARNAVSTVRDKYTLHVLGCALLRAGEYAEAIVPFLEANEGRQGAGQMNAFPLAIAYQHLGDEIQSRHWFVFGIRQMALALEDDPERAAWGPRNWLNANVWRREAEALLQWPTPRPLESTPDIKSSPLVSLPAAGGDETAGRADED